MAQLNINMDPQEALDNINAHDHASGLGNQITTASIVNNAVTADKLAASAVTTEKIAGNAVTTDKVADGSITAGKIAAGVLASSGVVGLTDYIGKGAKIKPNADLSVAVEPLEASIAGAYQQTGADTNVSLDARKASLIYAQKGTGGIPVLGKVNAVYPEADANTVLRYTFSEIGNPQDTSGNDNHITSMVGCTRVDGWADYAKQGDGSTGYMVSGATTGFPTSAQERQLDIIYTCKSITTDQEIIGYGTSGTGASFCIRQINARLYVDYSSNIDTGFDLEIGKTYLISACYDGISVLLYVNGMLVNKTTYTLNTGAGVLYIFRYFNSSVCWSNGIIHYVELRNKIRTPAQIGQIANKLCLPCRYTGPNASYPTISASDLLLAYHEWKFDETSGSTVADSAGTLNGTATGTTIVDSELGLGKTRRFNGSSDIVTLGSYSMPTDFTVIFVGRIETNGVYTAYLGNYTGSNDTYIHNNSSNKVQYSSGGTTVTSNSTVNLDALNIIAVTSKSTQVVMYINSTNPEYVGNVTTNTTSKTTWIGKTGGGALLKGTVEYFLIIPRALTQVEIAQYYNALMKTVEKDIREILPADSISLGFTRTNSTVVTEINDSDYKFGRREGATGGNRKVFLGWKYFSGATTLKWDNPFGTRKIKTYYTWAQDANGNNESTTPSAYTVGASAYGVYRLGSSANSCVVQTQANGAIYFNTSWQTSGYIGCYAEIIE